MINIVKSRELSCEDGEIVPVDTSIDYRCVYVPTYEYFMHLDSVVELLGKAVDELSDKINKQNDLIEDYKIRIDILEKNNKNNNVNIEDIKPIENVSPVPSVVQRKKKVFFKCSK